TGTASTIDIDPNAANNAATATVTVLNVPPKVTSISLSASSIKENDSTTLTVDFTDPGKYDMHSAQIDWGDGPVQIVTIPLGDRSFSVSHQYLDDNPTNTPSDVYAIKVTVLDNYGGNGDGQTSLTVSNVAPSLSNVTVTPAIDENGVATLSGDITDVGS